MLLIKKYFSTLRASRRYGKACRLVEKEKYADAKKHVDFALSLESFGFMNSLHQALKAEIEYELGNFDESKNIIIKLQEEFKANPDIWDKKDGKEVVKKVNWYWGQLENRAT